MSASEGRRHGRTAGDRAGGRVGCRPASRRAARVPAGVRRGPGARVAHLRGERLVPPVVAGSRSGWPRRSRACACRSRRPRPPTSGVAGLGAPGRLVVAMGALTIAVLVLAYRAGREQARGLRDGDPPRLALAGSAIGPGVRAPDARDRRSRSPSASRSSASTGSQPVLWAGVRAAAGGERGPPAQSAALAVARDAARGAAWGRSGDAARSSAVAPPLSGGGSSVSFVAVPARWRPCPPGPTGAYARFVVADRRQRRRDGDRARGAAAEPVGDRCLAHRDGRGPRTLAGRRGCRPWSWTRVAADRREPESGSRSWPPIRGARTATRRRSRRGTGLFLLVPLAATVLGGHAAAGDERQADRRARRREARSAGVVFAVLCGRRGVGRDASWFPPGRIALTAARRRSARRRSRPAALALAWGVVGGRARAPCCRGPSVLSAGSAAPRCSSSRSACSAARPGPSPSSVRGNRSTGCGRVLPVPDPEERLAVAEQVAGAGVRVLQDRRVVRVHRHLRRVGRTGAVVAAPADRVGRDASGPACGSAPSAANFVQASRQPWSVRGVALGGHRLGCPRFQIPKKSAPYPSTYR